MCLIAERISASKAVMLGSFVTEAAMLICFITEAAMLICFATKAVQPILLPSKFSASKNSLVYLVYLVSGI